ncbi:MAG: hypothetical protein WCJ87_02200 [Burkholderiales bacterium]|jgi:hypothetical protein
MAAQRAADAKAEALQGARNVGMPVLPRTSLVGKTVDGPVLVRGELGQTVVANSLVVNSGVVASAAPGATAAVVDVRCPFVGNRVLIHGTRVINNGRVLSFADNATAAVVLDRCSGLGQSTGWSSSSSNNVNLNRGQVKAGR